MNSLKICQNRKNANRVTFIIYLWLKCLIFPSFWLELCKTLESDGQEIKISTRHFCCFYRKILIFATHGLMTILNKWSKCQRSNQYSMRYGILKSYPIGITFCCIEMIEKHVIQIRYDLKMPYLLEYFSDRFEILNTYLIWSLHHV